MGTRRTNQSGFGTVQILLAIAVILVIGTAGWFVYQHNRVKVTNTVASTNQTGNQQTTATQPTQTTATPAQNIVKIPELGVQITVPDSIKDLIYTVGKTTLHDGRQETYAVFSTTTLTTADASCGTKFGPLGSLAAITGQYPTSFSDSDPPMEYGQLVKQLPTFFISASFPNGGNCSSNTTAGSDTAATSNNNRASSSKQAFSSSLKTIQTAN